jgi:hypothetical protein
MTLLRFGRAIYLMPCLIEREPCANHGLTGNCK